MSLWMLANYSRGIPSPWASHLLSPSKEMIKKPYQMHRMTPASAYWHYLRSFCAFGLPGIEPMYMKKEALEALPGIYGDLKKFISEYIAAHPHDDHYSLRNSYYTLDDFVNSIVYDYSFPSVLKHLVPLEETKTKRLIEIFSPIREEMNRCCMSLELLKKIKSPRLGINCYGSNSSKKLLDLCPTTTKTVGNSPIIASHVLSSRVIEYAIKHHRDRFLNNELLRIIGTQNSNIYTSPLSSFDDGTPWPFSIPLHIALPNFSRSLRFVCERTFGADRTVRLYPVRYSADGIVYVIPMPLYHIRRYMNAECDLNPGNNTFKSEFIRLYTDILTNPRGHNANDVTNRMIFVARVINGSPTENGLHTAHWIRTPPQHGGSINNVMAHVYGIPEHYYRPLGRT